MTKIAQSPHRQHVRSTRARRDAHLRKNTCMDARTHVLSILRTRLSKSIRAACVYWPRLRHQVRNRKTWFLSLLARLFVLGNRSSPYACRAPSIFLHWIPIWRHKERRNWNTHTSGLDTYFTYKHRWFRAGNCAALIFSRRDWLIHQLIRFFTFTKRIIMKGIS